MSPSNLDTRWHRGFHLSMEPELLRSVCEGIELLERMDRRRYARATRFAREVRATPGATYLDPSGVCHLGAKDRSAAHRVACSLIAVSTQGYFARRRRDRPSAERARVERAICLREEREFLVRMLRTWGAEERAIRRCVASFARRERRILKPNVLLRAWAWLIGS
jgi:hypothetical protein